MSDLFDISGRTAVVTGGSRGIGKMIAGGLVQAGARVVVSSRKAEDLQVTATELAAVGDCHPIPADLSTPEGAVELARAVRERFDRSIFSSTTRARHGVRRWTSSPPSAGMSVIRTNVARASSTSLSRCCRRSRFRASSQSPRTRHQHRVGRRAARADDGKLQLQRQQGRRAHADQAISPSASRPSTSRSTRSRPVRSRAR